VVHILDFLVLAFGSLKSRKVFFGFVTLKECIDKLAVIEHQNLRKQRAAFQQLLSNPGYGSNLDPQTFQ